jgi:hypothetical protein
VVVVVSFFPPGRSSHHNITLEYDEDTTSFMIDPTLTMAETLLSDVSNFSAGNAPFALEYYCYENAR